jgi:hypothetical protein
VHQFGAILLQKMAELASGTTPSQKGQDEKACSHRRLLYSIVCGVVVV